MSFFDYFRRKHKKSARVAKDRLQIIVSRERGTRGGRKTPDYLPALQQELLAVLAKYEKIDLDQVQVKIDSNNDCDLLELNVVIPAPVPETVAQVG